MKHPLAALLAAAALAPAALLHAQTGKDILLPPSNFVDRPAIFEITTDVLNAGLEPFTVTGPDFGNTIKPTGRGGFEPISFRNRLTAERDSPDRIYSSGGGGLGNWNKFASGYLDGAEVRVYRIIDGKVRLVRDEIVPPGGCVIEEWNYSNNRITPAGSTAGDFKWDNWTRPGAQLWFTVFAIDQAGNLSAPAVPIKLPFTKAAASAKADAKTEAFRPKKDAKSPNLSAPKNFRAETGADGIVRMTWDPVAANQLAGYVIARTDTDPASHRGAYLQLTGKPADPAAHVKQGDFVIVSKEMAPFEPSYLSHRVAGLERIVRSFLPRGVPNSLVFEDGPDRRWRLGRHTSDTPVEEPGKTYFEMTLKTGETEHVGHNGIPDIASTQHPYYPTPEPVEYRMEVWLKADRADAPPVVFQHHGDNRVGGFLAPHSLQPTTSWRKYTHTFTGRSTDTGNHAYFVLTCAGPATYSIDNFRVFRADTPFLDYTPEEYALLRESGMMAYRTHGPIKTDTTSYSMDQFTEPAGLVEGTGKGGSLSQSLRMMEKAGVHPWLQIEYHMSPAEWLGFAEYFAAPYDPAKDTPQTKPWAFKRHRQGRAAPWADAFDRVYFELANETWNSLFAPWTFIGLKDGATGKNYTRGEVYGLFHDHVVGILRSSPYWTPEIDKKFVHIMGGWAISSYNDEIARTSRTGDFITVGAYNGGWDEGEGPPRRLPSGFVSGLNFANQTAIPRAQKLLENAVKWEAGTGRHFKLGTYEAGPGYALNGLNNAKVSKEQAAEQEQVMKSKAAGVATLDTFLAQAVYDFDLQNYFMFSAGDYWTSHTKWNRGRRAHPGFLYLSLFNNEGTGDLLRVATRGVPTLDMPEFKRRQAIVGAPQIAVYATRDGDRVNVFVLSRRYPGYPENSGDGHTVVGLKLPFTKAANITLHRATGSPDDTNLDTEAVRLESTPVAPAALRPNGQFVIGPDTGGTARGLPPAEVFLYVFEGTDIGPAGKRLTRDDVVKLPVTFTAP
ncbi:MAG: hypothetical protein ABII82_16570 [Verrucomicrobiota bacterium]